MPDHFDAPSSADRPDSVSAADLRVAYFITSYGSGEQLHRLVTTLRAAEPVSPIVIRHDTFNSQLDPQLFAGFTDVHVLDGGEPIVWGDMSLESTRWNVFRWILANLDIDWVVLLSEQDYPIEPLQSLRADFATSGADAFLAGERIDQIDDPGLRREFELRYLYQYVSLPDIAIVDRLPQVLRKPIRELRGMVISAFTRVQKKVFIYTMDALQLPMRIGVKPRTTIFSDEFPCWKNDCWCALSRRTLEHIVSYLDTHPEFIKYYERTVIPLESATGTIVFNDPDLVVKNVPTHTVRWSDPDSGRPDVFTEADLEYLRSSGNAFARKFGYANTTVFDELDKIVLANAQESK